MQLHILTSGINTGLIPIKNFKYLYEYARCCKCNFLLALQNSRTAYAANKEFVCLHEMELPFEINMDCFINFLQIDKSIFEQYEEFFIPDKWNWIILPTAYWIPYINGELTAVYDFKKEKFDIFLRNEMIPQIRMYSKREVDSFEELAFFKNVEAYINRSFLLREPYIVRDMHLHPVIQQAYNNKVSAGRLICQVKDENIDIVFYFFKSLFSMAKSDTLDMLVRFDKFETNLFVATFLPKKKKNPLQYNPDKYVFSEKIHVMYMNLR